MSTNCIRCVRNKRTGFDLLCDECRNANEYRGAMNPVRKVCIVRDYLDQGRFLIEIDVSRAAEYFASKTLRGGVRRRHKITLGDRAFTLTLTPIPMAEVVANASHEGLPLINATIPPPIIDPERAKADEEGGAQ